MSSSTPASLRLKPNVLFSGQAATARVEWLPPEHVGKRFTLELVELDEDRVDPRPLAVFSAEVAQAPEGEEGLRFANAERQVREGEETALPGPDEDGITWAVPHLRLSLDGCEGEHVVIVGAADARDRRQAEGMSFELALRLVGEDGVEVYPAGQPPPYTELNCHTVLAENGGRAAVAIKARHDRALQAKGLGAYFGKMSAYRSAYESDWGDGHVNCHWCALREQDAGDGRTPPPKTRQDAHEPERGPLQMTDCTMYVLQTLDLAFRKSRAAADAAWYTNRRARQGVFSGLDVGQGLQAMGWVMAYFSAQGDQHDDTLWEIDHEGWVRDRQSPDVENKARIDVTVRGHADEAHPDHEYASTKFDKLCRLPFVIFLPGNQVHMLIGVQGKLYECHWGAGPRSADLFDCSDDVLSRFGNDDFFAFMPVAYFLQHVEPMPERLKPLKIEWPELQLPTTLPARAGS